MEKGFVLTEDTCMVLLGNTSNAFLILPKDKDVNEVASMVRPYLATGTGTTNTEALRVCVWNKTTELYENVAAMKSPGLVQISKSGMGPALNALTTELCKDFWQDVWNDDVWFPKVPHDGIIKGSQGVSCVPGTTPPDSGVWNKTYNIHNEQGIFQMWQVGQRNTLSST